MKISFSSQTRDRVIALVFIGLAVRVIMPAGYMPAAIADGGPFVLCPGGLSGAISLPSADSNTRSAHHHGEGDNGSANAWKFCPFGALLGSQGPIAETPAAIMWFGTHFQVAESAAPLQSIAACSPHARGPPTDQSLYL